MPGSAKRVFAFDVPGIEVLHTEVLHIEVLHCEIDFKAWMAGASPAMTQRGNDTMVEIRVPTLGESVTEATIGRWFKKAGDTVAVDEPLVELETDKVTIEVPAPSAGTLGEIAAKDGDTVAVGALLGMINDGAGPKPAAAKPAAAPPPPPPAAAAQPAPAAKAP